MARYLLVSIPDTVQAEGLAGAIGQLGGVFFYQGLSNGESRVDQLKDAKVIGIFGQPTSYCQHPPSPNFVKGAKLGWQVCVQCKKPIRGWQHPRNLLAPLDEAPRDRMLYLGIVEGLDKPPAKRE